MKTALLQCNPVTGDIVGNMQRIAEAVRRAGNVDLCVTPELALSGIAPGDYLSMHDFVEGCSHALDQLAYEFKCGPDLIVGAPVMSVYDSTLLSNAAVYIHNGQWEVVSRKIRPEASHDPDACFFDRGVTCGIIVLRGWRLGIVLCENDERDSFWNVRGTGHNPLLDLIARGVDALIYLQATPYVIGHRAETEAMLTHVAARHHIHLLAVNLVGGNDGLIFGGQSLALNPTGSVYARGKAFEEDVLVVDTATGTSSVSMVGKSWEENVFGALVLGTRDFVRKSGLEHAIVGVSGGMDSALVLAIAVEALGAKNVLAVHLPDKNTPESYMRDTRLLTAALDVECAIIPIDELMRAYMATMQSTIDTFTSVSDELFSKNIEARIRSTLLSSLANRAQALVLNATNKSESAVGYCTLYGDSIGSLGVIADLTKTQVYAVANWYNSKQGQDIIPQSIFEQAPDSERNPNQRPGDNLPAYTELDPILDTLLNAQSRREMTLTSQGKDVRDALFHSEFKRSQEPQPLYVSSKPFGRSWIVPLVGHFSLPKKQST